MDRAGDLSVTHQERVRMTGGYLFLYWLQLVASFIITCLQVCRSGVISVSDNALATAIHR